MFIIIGLLLLASTGYWFFTKEFNYWRKRGIKGPKPLLIFGNSLEMLLTPKIDWELNYYRKYGSLYGYYLGNEPVLVVGEPELIKNILVEDFNVFPYRPGLETSHPILKKSLATVVGDDWKRIRSITSPTFTPSKMKLMYPLMEDCVNDHLVQLDDLAKVKSNVNVQDIFGNLTLDVIASSAFATKLTSRNQLDLFVKHAKQILNVHPIKILLLRLMPKSFFTMAGVAFAMDWQLESLNFYVNVVRQMLKNRKENGQKLNDFLQLLMEADLSVSNDETDRSGLHHVNGGKEELEMRNVKFNSSNKKLDEDEVIAQATTFLLAGYETTATALTYATYELALNPDVQDKLRDEVNASLNSNGKIDYDVLCRLPYLDAVVSETLRHHSPSVRAHRVATEEYKVGNTGITLYPGQQVDIPIYAIHHDERYYKNPFKFDPERFMPQNRDSLVPYTYLPFGAGPRHCIGMRFALLEAKLALAQMIRRYTFYRCDETDVPLTPDTNIFHNIPKRAIVGIGMRE